MDHPTLLALDLSTNVGFAVMRRGAVPLFGTRRLQAVDDGMRFAELLEWLGEMRSVHQFQALAYEEPILPRKSGDLATTMSTLTLLWGLTSTVKLYAAWRRMSCKGCPVQQAKITLCGKANATKDEMVVAAMQTMNWRVSDDHQADAGAVGMWAYEQLWPKARAA